MAPRTYRVTAPSEVLGQKSGTEFKAELDPVQEQRLLTGGALEVVDRPVQAEPKHGPKAPPQKSGD